MVVFQTIFISFFSFSVLYNLFYNHVIFIKLLHVKENKRNVLLVFLLCWDFLRIINTKNEFNILKVYLKCIKDLWTSIWTDLVQSLVTPSNSFHLTFDFPLFLIGQNTIQRPRVRRAISSMCDLKQKDFVKNMILPKNKASFSQIEF